MDEYLKDLKFYYKDHDKKYDSKNEKDKSQNQFFIDKPHCLNYQILVSFLIDNYKKPRNHVINYVLSVMSIFLHRAVTVERNFIHERYSEKEFIPLNLENTFKNKEKLDKRLGYDTDIILEGYKKLVPQFADYLIYELNNNGRSFTFDLGIISKEDPIYSVTTQYIDILVKDCLTFLNVPDLINIAFHKKLPKYGNVKYMDLSIIAAIQNKEYLKNIPNDFILTKQKVRMGMEDYIAGKLLVGNTNSISNVVMYKELAIESFYVELFGRSYDIFNLKYDISYWDNFTIQSKKKPKKKKIFKNIEKETNESMQISREIMINYFDSPINFEILKQKKKCVFEYERQDSVSIIDKKLKNEISIQTEKQFLYITLQDGFSIKNKKDKPVYQPERVEKFELYSSYIKPVMTEYHEFNNYCKNVGHEKIRLDADLIKYVMKGAFGSSYKSMKIPEITGDVEKQVNEVDMLLKIYLTTLKISLALGDSLNKTQKEQIKSYFENLSDLVTGKLIENESYAENLDHLYMIKGYVPEKIKVVSSGN